MIIKERNIVVCIILTLVTCGIYGIYWAICLARESVYLKDEKDDALLEIILMILLPFLGFYLCEKKRHEGFLDKNLPTTDKSIIYLILGLFGLSIVNYCMLQNDLNLAAIK